MRRFLFLLCLMMFVSCGNSSNPAAVRVKDDPSQGGTVTVFETDEDVTGERESEDELRDRLGRDREQGGSGSICGNQRTETGEQCDDGGTVSGDGCSSACQNEIGSGPVAPLEIQTSSPLSGLSYNVEQPQTLKVTGGVPPYAWDMLNSPSGLFLEDQRSGSAPSCSQDPSGQLACDQDGYVLLKGKPLNVGKFSKIDVIVTDSRGVKVSKTFELIVSETPEIKIYKGYGHYQGEDSEDQDVNPSNGSVVQKTLNSRGLFSLLQQPKAKKGDLSALLQPKAKKGDLIAFTSTPDRYDEAPSAIISSGTISLAKDEILKIEIVGHGTGYVWEFDDDSSQWGNAHEKRVQAISVPQAPIVYTAKSDGTKVSVGDASPVSLYLRVKHHHYEKNLTIPIRVRDSLGNIKEDTFTVRGVDPCVSAPPFSVESFTQLNDIHLPLLAGYEEGLMIRGGIKPYTFSISYKDFRFRNDDPVCAALAKEMINRSWSIISNGNDSYLFYGATHYRTDSLSTPETMNRISLCGDFYESVWIEAKDSCPQPKSISNHAFSSYLFNRLVHVSNVALEQNFIATIPLPGEVNRGLKVYLLDSYGEAVYARTRDLMTFSNDCPQVAGNVEDSCAELATVLIPDVDVEYDRKRATLRRPPTKVTIEFASQAGITTENALKFFLTGSPVEIKGSTWAVSLDRNWSKAEKVSRSKGYEGYKITWENIQWRYIGK